MEGERTRPWVIIGGGLAAGRAAAELRKEGFDGHLVVVTNESRQPYERPPLSKDYLRGETKFEKLLATDPGTWEDPSIELMRGRRATRLDLGQRRIELDDGGSLPFGKLLLATGASAIRPRMPGADAAFVHTLRTVEDSDSIRASASAASGGRVVIAGGGWIAAEVAASLRQLGNEVTLAFPENEVLEQRLGREVGALYSALHERHGVHLIRKAWVAEIADDRRGRGLVLKNGDLIPADMVVLGFGATPNVSLAADAGLEIDNGVLADAELQTKAPDVFVAGDVASPWHDRYERHLRVEHWDTAREQGRTAALNMLGRGEAYERVPYFYSDQFELGMEDYGLPGDAGEVVIRQIEDGERFVSLWIADGRVLAGLHGNDWDSADLIRQMVTEKMPIDVGRFKDPSVPLSTLLAARHPV